MYRVCASAEATLYTLRVCTCILVMSASVCRSRALRSTLKMISKVNDVPRFAQTSPWKRWPASLPVMIDLLRSSSADCEGDGSISEIDREWSRRIRANIFIRRWYFHVTCDWTLNSRNFLALTWYFSVTQKNFFLKFCILSIFYNFGISQLRYCFPWFNSMNEEAAINSNYIC